MRARLQRYLRVEDKTADFPIGCIILTQPLFPRRKHWIPAPSDWRLNIVQG
jgi:hypothetical protein